MSKLSKSCALLGALWAALWVLLSAASAHMSLQVSPAAMAAALNLHQFHALAFLVLAALIPQRQSRWWGLVVLLFLLGGLLFCANIYARAIWGWDAQRSFVPIGGTCFIAGWLVTGLALWRGQPPRELRP